MRGSFAVGNFVKAGLSWCCDLYANLMLVRVPRCAPGLSLVLGAWFALIPPPTLRCYFRVAVSPIHVLVCCRYAVLRSVNFTTRRSLLVESIARRNEIEVDLTR